jgi:hypothetical protein
MQFGRYDDDWPDTALLATDWLAEVSEPYLPRADAAHAERSCRSQSPATLSVSAVSFKYDAHSRSSARKRS